MQMKKALLLIILLISASFSGCSRDADTFLAYSDHAYNAQELINYTITEGDFFAKDIAIISDGVNSGEDENLNAGAVLLVDINNNKTIYSSNAYDSMYPASLVKLLTSLIVLEDGELTDNVTISRNAVKIAEKRAKVCGFKEGDTMTMETLLNCLLVFSGNDAAIAIAEHIGGTESDFVALMNKKALQLGAAASVFANPHGLHDDTQYTTAYDMYLIFNKLLKYDSFRTIINKNVYEAEYFDKSGNNKHKSFSSTNLYLTGDVKTQSGLEVIGGISGSTKKSGSCMILLCKDSNNTEYIAVILNSSNNEVLYSQMSYLLSLAVAE
jgi:D-alanyl-D-alanine carboxypeptidase